MSFADYLVQQGASRGAVSLLSMSVLGICGDGLDSCSAASILRDVVAASEAHQMARIAGGNDRLPQAFAATLRDRIWLGCRVVEVVQSPSGVRVTFQTDGVDEYLEAERLVCALPFSTLQRVRMEPPLPVAKRQAIAALPYTSVCRVFLQFKERFWTATGLSGFGAIDDPLMRVRECMQPCRTGRVILECYFSGGDARDVMRLHDRERLDYALVQLEKLYPGAADYFETGASKCWDEDEWARGAYAFFRPGQMASMSPHIASAVERIHFAGDHTSQCVGWMEGAFQSADRVVREVATVQ